MCYHMRRFPVGYQSGQLGRTVNPLALPSYVRIVDPPPFFARGFGHGLFCFTALLLHENTKERKGLGTRGGVTAAPENRERSVQAQRAKPSTATENRARDKRATDGAVDTMLTAPFPRRHKRPNRRCRRFRRYRSAPAGRLTKPLAPHSPIGTSQTCRGCRENFSLPGCGAAPHIQLSYLLICQSPLCPLWFFVSFVVNPHWQSCVREHVARLCAPLSSL